MQNGPHEVIFVDYRGKNNESSRLNRQVFLKNLYSQEKQMCIINLNLKIVPKLRSLAKNVANFCIIE